MAAKKSRIDQSTFDVCVVCALPEEGKAFVKAAKELYGVAFEEAFNAENGQGYPKAMLENRDGEPLALQVSWQPKMGPVDAGIHVLSVVNEYQPRFVAMTGI